MVELRALAGHFFERDDIVTFYSLNFDVGKQREVQRAGREEVKIRQ
jgi:hypothetical protein